MVEVFREGRWVLVVFDRVLRVTFNISGFNEFVCILAGMFNVSESMLFPLRDSKVKCPCVVFPYILMYSVLCVPGT